MALNCIGCGEPGAGASEAAASAARTLCPDCRAALGAFLDRMATAFKVPAADLSIVGIHAVHGPTAIEIAGR